jgi:hypothetical protein
MAAAIQKGAERDDELYSRRDAAATRNDRVSRSLPRRRRCRQIALRTPLFKLVHGPRGGVFEQPPARHHVLLLRYFKIRCIKYLVVPAKSGTHFSHGYRLSPV